MSLSFKHDSARAIILSIATIFISVASSHLQAGYISYRIDPLGNITGSTSLRYYEADDDTEQTWTLDSANNTVQLSGYGPALLNTTLFQVSDILDVTLTSGVQSWMTTTDGTSYQIDPFGNITGSTSLRFYEADDDTEQTWRLDSVNNTVQLSGYGPAPLNTTLFQVSDIVDVTWTSGVQSWMTTTDGTSYRIDPYGNVTGSTSWRYYEADDDTEQYWTLDSVNNNVYLTGYGFVSLNTSLFQVSDIVDVTWSNSSYSWMIVDDGISSVPVPAAAWLFSSGLFALIGVSRRKQADQFK